METLEAHAFVQATNARFREIGTELGLLRTNQDAATATVISITEDIAGVRTEVRNTQQINQEHFAQAQAQVASLSLDNLSIMIDEKIKTALSLSAGLGIVTEGKLRHTPTPNSRE